MKKPILIAPRASTREILPGTDADRLLASGSWCRVNTTKPESANVRNQRKYRHHRSEQGCRRLDVWVSEQVFNDLQARRREGESLAAIIKRLLTLPDETDEKG